MPHTFRILTFNIRYGTAEDGSNSWSNRRDLVIRTIDDAQPDVLGVQEALDFQFDFLSERLPGYQALGVGRDDGNRAGEYAALFVRRDRLQVVEHGEFWLSETPHVPGSRGWEAKQPRIVTWCRLKIATEPTQEFLVFNTHFDHRSELSRVEGARLLRKEMNRLATSQPVIVMGDFNATEREMPYTLLRDGEPGNEQLEQLEELIDAYRAVHPICNGQELTHQGFQPHQAGLRIDWIFHSPAFTPLAAEIIRTSFAGQLPSDHYPVSATLQLN